MSYRRKSLKAPTSASASSSSHSDGNDASKLDYLEEDDMAETNAKNYLEWREMLTYKIASLHDLVSDILIVEPGTEFEREAEPKLGDSGVSEATLPMFLQGHVKYLTKVKSELKKVAAVVRENMTQRAKDVVARNPLWTTHQLEKPSGDTVHHLLKAIHLTFMTRDCVPAEQASVEALTSFLNGEQQPTESLEMYRRAHTMRKQLVTDHGEFALTASQEGFVFMRGLSKS